MKILLSIALLINLIISYIVFFDANYSLSLATEFQGVMKKDLTDKSEVRREYVKEEIKCLDYQYALPQMRGQVKNTKLKLWSDIVITLLYFLMLWRGKVLSKKKDLSR